MNSLVVMDGGRIEAQKLVDVVKNGQRVVNDTLVTMRQALLELKETQGWKALGYQSFEDMGRVEFGYQKAHLYRLAEAAEIERSILLPAPEKSPIGDSKEIPETQLRPLAKVPEDERKAIWDEANRKAAEANKALTAKMVADAVDDYKRRLADKEEMIKAQHDKLMDMAKASNDRIALLEKQLSKERREAMQREEEMEEKQRLVDAEVAAKEQALAAIEKRAADTKARLEELNKQYGALAQAKSIEVRGNQALDIVERLMLDISTEIQAFQEDESEAKAAQSQELIDRWIAFGKKLASGGDAVMAIINTFKQNTL